MSAAAETITYESLLHEYAPAVPTTDEEHREALELLGRFMARGGNSLAEGERKFVGTLAALIADYERRRFQREKAAPADILRELMRGRDMKPKDLWGVFGSKGITSEVLRGKRGISKERAKALAEIFCVPVDLFI
jgi:HTH-type transcriptional regulator/antitoxin HigA